MREGKGLPGSRIGHAASFSLCLVCGSRGGSRASPCLLCGSRFSLSCLCLCVWVRQRAQLFGPLARHLRRPPQPRRLPLLPSRGAPTMSSNFSKDHFKLLDPCSTTYQAPFFSTTPLHTEKLIAPPPFLSRLLVWVGDDCGWADQPSLGDVADRSRAGLPGLGSPARGRGHQQPRAVLPAARPQPAARAGVPRQGQDP